MLEELRIVELNIVRYHATPGSEQRACVEQLLAEANRALAETTHQLARAIDVNHEYHAP